MVCGPLLSVWETSFIEPDSAVMPFLLVISARNFEELHSRSSCNSSGQFSKRWYLDKGKDFWTKKILNVGTTIMGCLMENTRVQQTEEIVKLLTPWLEKQKKPAWKPDVTEEDGPLTASKFCGTPWIGESATWPDCGNCNQPM